MEVTEQQPEDEEPAFTTGVPLLSITTPVCMFPVDRQHDTHLFCGQPRRDPKTSYCAEHHKLVWTPSGNGLRKLESGGVPE